jgi:alkylated DNA repair dioxygenase AlkB
VRIGPLPDWALSLAIRLKADCVTPWIPDQTIVNEYQPGQGISPHVDFESFADTIVSLSLGSACIMELTTVGTGATPLLLEPRSVLILAGEARRVWQHSIPARKRDVWMGATFLRTRRVSLTFRKVLQ